MVAYVSIYLTRRCSSEYYVKVYRNILQTQSIHQALKKARKPRRKNHHKAKHKARPYKSKHLGHKKKKKPTPVPYSTAPPMKNNTRHKRYSQTPNVWVARNTTPSRDSTYLPNHQYNKINENFKFMFSNGSVFPFAVHLANLSQITVHNHVLQPTSLRSTLSSPLPS